MIKRRATTITKEEIIENYINDFSATMHSVAPKLGCSYNTLRKIMKVYSIQAKPKTRNWKRKPSIPELDNSEWLGNQMQTKSMKQIALELDTSHGRVSYFVHKHQIDWPYKNRTQAVKAGIKKRFPNGRFGELASNWRGGKIKRKSGIQIYQPDHPYADKKGYVMEHRLIIEKQLNRYLNSDEYVHHVNGDPYDNRLENLKLVTRKEHAEIHFDAVKEVAQLKAENDQLKAEIERLKKTIL